MLIRRNVLSIITVVQLFENFVRFDTYLLKFYLSF